MRPLTRTLNTLALRVDLWLARVILPKPLPKFRGSHPSQFLNTHRRCIDYPGRYL